MTALISNKVPFDKMFENALNFLDEYLEFLIFEKLQFEKSIEIDFVLKNKVE